MAFRTCFTRLAIVVAVVCAALTASAQGRGEPSEAEKEQAKEHFFAGKQAQDAGDYEVAVREYEKAYDLIPEPLLLFNLGQVHRLAGNKKEAVEYYERYLHADPDGRGAEIADKFKQQLLSELREEEAEQTRKREARRKQLEKERKLRRKRSQEQRSTSSSSSSSVLRWSGIGLVAAGAISVGVGIKFGLDAKSISDELSEPRDAWTPELLAKEDEGASAETKMYLFTAIGSAAIVGGGLMYYFGWRSEKDDSGERAMWFVPTADGDSVGAVFGGRF